MTVRRNAFLWMQRAVAGQFLRSLRLVFILQSCFRAGHSPSISVADCNKTCLWMMIVQCVIAHGCAMPNMNACRCFWRVAVPQCSCEGTKDVRIIIEVCDFSVNEKQMVVCQWKVKILFYCQGWILGASALRNTKPLLFSVRNTEEKLLSLCYCFETEIHKECCAWARPVMSVLTFSSVLKWLLWATNEMLKSCPRDT